MLNGKRIIAFLVCLALALSSCTKSPAPTQLKTNFPSPPPAFPNKVGNVWVYHRTYSGDTLWVKIIGRGLLPNGDSASIWRYSYKLVNQTITVVRWVSEVNNSALVYRAPCFQCPSPAPEIFRYLFPLSVGQRWSGTVALGDSTRVLSQEIKLVPAGKFASVYKILSWYPCFANDCKTDTIFFKEQVGVVKFFQNEFHLGPDPTNGTWDLVSYTLH